MKIKVIYRKNLKMSEQKVASQVAHAVKNLGTSPSDCSIIVLKVSDKKFNELSEFHDCYIQKDLGLTEVKAGTSTAAAWIEVDDQTLLNYYNQGWQEEADGENRVIDQSKFLTGMRRVAYSIGCADYKAGDDVSSIDEQTEEQILEKIKNQEVK